MSPVATCPTTPILLTVLRFLTQSPIVIATAKVKHAEYKGPPTQDDDFMGCKLVTGNTAKSVLMGNSLMSFTLSGILMHPISGYFEFRGSQRMHVSISSINFLKRIRHIEIIIFIVE